MAFDPDAYLGSSAAAADAPFNPDTYLSSFDPDKYLAASAPASSSSFLDKVGRFVFGSPPKQMQAFREGKTLPTEEASNPAATKSFESPLISSDYIKPLLRTQAAIMTGGGSELTRALPGVGPIQQGIEEGVSGGAASMTSPQNLSLLATGALGKTAQIVLAAGFEAQAIKSAPDQWKAYSEATDPKEKAKILTEMALGLGVPLAAAGHISLGKSPGAQEKLVPASPEADVSTQLRTTPPAIETQPLSPVPETVAPAPIENRSSQPQPTLSDAQRLELIRQQRPSSISSTQQTPTLQQRMVDWELGNEADRKTQNVHLMAERLYNEALAKSSGPNINRELDAEISIAREKMLAQTITPDKEILQAYDLAHQMASQMVEARHGSMVSENRPTKYVDYEAASRGVTSPPSVTSVTQSEEAGAAAKPTPATSTISAAPERTTPKTTIDQPQDVPQVTTKPMQTPGLSDTAGGVTGDEPHVSSIANRFVQERVARGEVGEIAPGQGYSTADLIQRGLKMSPEEINQHVSDLMQGGGDPIRQGEAVRAEEARLSERSNQLSRAAEANLGNIQAQLAADNAFKDLTDFHNGPVARVKQNWHAQGMGMQGEIPVDLSTFNGLREQWLRDIGKAPPKSVEPTLRRTARNVARSVAEENSAMSRLGQEIEKATRGRKLPNADEVRNRIRERLGLEPCR